MKSWPSLAEKSRTLEYKDGTLFYYDSAGSAGSKKPALILIHGLGDEADSWRHVFPLLSEAGFRVLALDLPGFGRSAAKGRINIDRHAEAVLELMRAAGAADRENPAALAGSSMGAVIAEAAAFRRPDLVKALILIDGCFPMAGKADKSLLITGLPFIGKKWYRAFRSDHQGAWQSLYGYYHDLDALPEEDRAFLRERVIARVESEAQERAYFASLRSLILVSIFGGAGFSFCVKNFPGKFQVIWGAEDRVLTREKAGTICSLRPDTASVLISGAGHLPQQEKPRETAAAIVDFLNALP
jgi:pimeloyl-ACP methyl ester carboxylesterase